MVRHIPVMTEQVVTGLEVVDGGLYVDCTLGEGGHALAVLEAGGPRTRLLGIEVDSASLDVARERTSVFAGQTVLVHESFADLDRVAGDAGFRQADGILFDLGISSAQVDTQERGFSFRMESRLDMRFDPSQGITAHDIVNRFEERELADIIFTYGEERRSRQVARAIVRARPIDSTTRLADVVTTGVGRRTRRGTHPATRTFQALRIAVNRELDNIDSGLQQAVDLLRSGGRLVVISYHSLEDRLVKNMFRREASDCICPPGTPECICNHTASLKLVGRRPSRPTEDEVARNPRSRSARLRVARKL